MAELLAELHSVSEPRFGFERETARQQNMLPNDWSRSWVEFFRDRRFLHLLQQARDAGHLDADMVRRLEHLARRLTDFVDEPPGASLLHGDVWKKNVLVRGERVVGFVDPAIFYGDPEFDLALTARSAFGLRTIEAYAAIRRLRPGYPDRATLYCLSVYLNLVYVRGPALSVHVDETLRMLRF